jgi:pimeloyl-ACP methyl ester carboxylesterase
VRTVRAAAAAVICAGLAGCGSAGSGTQPGGQVAASTTEVSFVVNGTTTYATLEVPAHRNGQHLAAALLLAGSGPTDRDGNQKPSLTPNTLRQIADALDGMGIMSLRFDKYFTGRTGGGSYASDPGSIDLNAYIRQADGAFKLLSDQPAADHQRLLVIGHSEGGMYALLVAETVSPHPAGLALVEPQDERLLDLVALQINESLDVQVSQGAITADAARQNAQGVRQAIEEFRAGQSVDTTGLLPSVVSMLTPLILTPGNARVALTDDAIDVPAYAAKLPSGTRVLVTDGTADRNVPPSTIQPLIDGLASAGTTGPGLQTLTGLDHDLNPAGTPPNGAPLDPAFLSALRTWAQPYTPTS